MTAPNFNGISHQILTGKLQLIGPHLPAACLGFPPPVMMFVRVLFDSPRLFSPTNSRETAERDKTEKNPPIFAQPFCSVLSLELDYADDHNDKRYFFLSAVSSRRYTNGFLLGVERKKVSDFCKKRY